MKTIPKNHVRRRELHDEAHARPPESLVAPGRMSFIALFDAGTDRQRQMQPVIEICRRYGATPPGPGANHFSADLGDFRIKWERHTEFCRYKFIVAGETKEPFSEPALNALPQDWIDGLPGEVIAAVHVVHCRYQAIKPDIDALSARYFSSNSLVGATVADGAALALTDFQIRDDGFSRLRLLDDHLAPRQAGRTVQRLLEVEAYRILALMVKPRAIGRGEPRRNHRGHGQGGHRR